MSLWLRYGIMKKMKFGITIKQRDIVLIPFPYSDFSTKKKRPVLIVSNQDYHKNNNDIICCAITSSNKPVYNGVSIDNNDMDEGNLKIKSTVKPGKIWSLHKDRIIMVIGRLNIIKTREIIKNLNLNINIDE